MLTIISLYRTPSPHQEAHGERSFWAWNREGERYCERFWAGVTRHVRGHVRRVMLTNAPDLFADWGEYVHVVPLVDEGKGWWCKLQCFRPDVSDGKCWYSDLDNVITGDLSEFFALKPEPLIMLEDRYYPGMANGSNFLFDAHHPVLRKLWDEYAAAPRAIEREFSKWPHASDQAFIANRVRKAGLPLPFAQNLLPAGYLLSGRDEIEKGADTSNVRLIFGAGDPKAHESNHPIYQEHWRAA